MEKTYTPAALPTKEKFPKINGKPYPDFFDRILQFDPVGLYERIGSKINRFSRANTWPSYDLAFPKVPGFCSCGCGQALTGRRTRWATDKCSDFAFTVIGIIVGRVAVYTPLVFAYYGHKCAECDADAGPGKGVFLEIDHTFPVKHGGGGCWLDNLKPICQPCHKNKTCRDFGHGKYKVSRTKKPTGKSAELGII